MVSVLIGAIVVIVMVVVLVTTVALRRRSQDEVHSVEHYHRSLQTLEQMRGRPSPAGDNGVPAISEPAFRVGTPMVRPIDPNRPPVASAGSPPVTNPSEPVILFDDAAPPAAPEHVEAAASAQGQSRSIEAMNRPRRRLVAPMTAVGAVALLVVVLVLTGLHPATPPRHAKTSAQDLARPAHRSQGSRQTTTTTTAPPVVSPPNASTNQTATYQVAVASYTLALSATRAECWVSATDSAGAVLFSGLLSGGQSQTVPATGPVTVVAGAPSVFAATVNGTPVTLPPDSLAPFTLKFVSSAPPGSG